MNKIIRKYCDQNLQSGWQNITQLKNFLEKYFILQAKDQ